VIGLILILAPMLAWVPDKPVEELVGRWAQAPSRFEQVEGLSVHLRDEGPRDDPVPIVLLHGTSASLHTWEGWAQTLATERRVLRFDLPGFALTGPRTDDDYSIDAYVKFVLAMLDHLGVQRVVLAGNSLGGQIAWNVAAANPERVERLILVNSAGYPLEAGARVPLAFSLARTPGLSVLLEHTLPRSLVARSVRDVYGDPDRVTPELVDLYRDHALRAGNRRALVRRFREPIAVNVDRIPSLTQPTLLIWGAEDRLFPPVTGERFAREIANSTLVVLDGLGHVPQEEDPVRTVAAVMDFLAQPMAMPPVD
jgi:pimeloyl-ACP methyl ester carboxylesterase